MADITDVLSKESQWSDLYQRFDDDEDLVNLDPYTLVDKEEREVPGIISVTLNQPATFAAHVFSALVGASQQVKVTGKDMDDKQTSLVEKFLNAFFLAADTRLIEMGEPTLRAFTTEQANLRGRMGARATVRMEKGEFIPEILPMDMRFVAYEMGVEGMLWGSYKTSRTPAMVESEYPEVDIPGATATRAGSTQGPTLVDVVDLWDKDRNQVFIAKNAKRAPTGFESAKSVPNTYDRVPFVVQTVPLGSMLKTEKARERYGESIFFLIRDLIPEMNRLASLLQSVNQSSILGGLTWHSKEGTQGTPPRGAGAMGTDTAADIGGGFERVPVGDINQAGQLFHSIITRAIQAGSLSATDFGNVQFPLSAVALVRLGESSNRVFLPRLGAIGLFYQQLARMVINQTIALGKKAVELGPPGHRQTFDVKDLKGDYYITYEYFVEDAQQEVARFSTAEVAQQWLDIDTINETILKLPNPAEVREKKRIDNAELISPEVALLRTASALIDSDREDSDLEAWVIAQQLQLTLQQIKSGQVPPERAPPSQNGQQPARNILPPPADTRAASNIQAAELSNAPTQSAEGG